MIPGQEQLDKMQGQLDLWQTRIDDLEAKSEAVAEAEKIGYRKGIKDLKKKFRGAQVKHSEFKAANTETWETFKAGVESAWNEVEVAFKKMTN